MRIALRKFGKILISRPQGREAFAAIRPSLDLSEPAVEIDFDGIISLSPSWADEFFSALRNIYGERVKFLPSDNLSVAATLRVLRESEAASRNL